MAPFAWPVAVLTDELSASASEVFTGGMRALHRVRVFGDTSLGAVLPAVWDKLPNGDVLVAETNSPPRPKKGVTDIVMGWLLGRAGGGGPVAGA